MKNYSAVKIKEILQYAAIPMNLEEYYANWKFSVRK